MIDLDELDRLEALHREAQKDPCDRGATCTKKCWRNYPCCVRKDRDDVQFRNAAADALPELLRAARKAATMTSAEGVISSLKATLESRRREVVAVTAERDAARAECERLRKLFDDAGAGEHNVLALIDHYQDEALKATSELAQARQLVALLEDRISDVEDRDDARTVCEWAATVALKSTDVHNAATRYLTGVQSPVYKPNRGPLRMIVPVAEVDPEYAPLIAAMRNALPALLQAARERDEAVRLLRWWNDGSSIDNVAEHAEEVAAFLARVSR